MEQVGDHRPLGRPGRGGQCQQRRRWLVAHQQHAQPVRMPELERRVAIAQRLPELPDAELPLPHHGVVEDHHAAARQLRQPGLEVVAHRFVGVQAIDVQQVDAAFGEVRRGLVEAHAHQLREAGVLGHHHGFQAVVHFVAVVPGLLIALPGVHGKGLARHPLRLDRLAESEEGRTVVRTQLDQDRGPQRLDQPEGERDVAGPGAGQQVLGHHRQTGAGRDHVHARDSCMASPVRASQ